MSACLSKGTEILFFRTCATFLKNSGRRDESNDWSGPDQLCSQWRVGVVRSTSRTQCRLLQLLPRGLSHINWIQLKKENFKTIRFFHFEKWFDSPFLIWPSHWKSVAKFSTTWWMWYCRVWWCRCSLCSSSVFHLRVVRKSPSVSPSFWPSLSLCLPLLRRCQRLLNLFR